MTPSKLLGIELKILTMLDSLLSLRLSFSSFDARAEGEAV